MSTVHSNSILIVSRLKGWPWRKELELNMMFVNGSYKGNDIWAVSQENLFSVFPTRPDTKRAVHRQMMTRGLKNRGIVLCM